MTRYLPFVIAAMAASLTFVTTAQAHTPSRAAIEARQDRQLELISVGRQTGSLTFFEGWKLKREQRRIAKFKRHYLADGVLNVSERNELRDAQNRASRNIWRERTDADVRGFFWRVFY